MSATPAWHYSSFDVTLNILDVHIVYVTKHCWSEWPIGAISQTLSIKLYPDKKLKSSFLQIEKSCKIK